MGMKRKMTKEPNTEVEVEELWHDKPVVKGAALLGAGYVGANKEKFLPGTSRVGACGGFGGGGAIKPF